MNHFTAAFCTAVLSSVLGRLSARPLAVFVPQQFLHRLFNLFKYHVSFLRQLLSLTTPSFGF